MLVRHSSRCRENPAVDKTLTNYPPYNTIHKFRLHIDIFWDDDLDGKIIPDYESYTYALLDKWINIALDKRVQDLDLQIRVGCIDRNVQEECGSAADYKPVYNYTESFEWRYHIPIRVLSSDFVRSLSLGWQVCLPRNMDLPLRSCSSLRSLELFRVNKDVDNKAFKRLIRACPAIEELIIDSEYIDKIKVSGLRRLKKISIRRYILNTATLLGRYSDFYIKIEAPSLETLCLLDTGRGRLGFCSYRVILSVDCYNLKCLKLIRDRTLRDYELGGFISKFPMLESLELEDCSLIKWINIRNPMMKKIKLKLGALWTDFRCVEISSPNVLDFRYESDKKVPSIWISKNNCPRYVEAVFKITQPIYLCPAWFHELRKSILGVNSNHTSLSFNYTWRELYGKVKELVDKVKKLVPTELPACKIDNLNLNVSGHSSIFPVILNCLFSTFHPTTLQASIVDDTTRQGHDFLQFLCEILTKTGNNTVCSICSVHYKCWKHQLKKVKFEGIKRSDGIRASLNWREMLKLLPNLPSGDQICFRLEWPK